MQFKLIYFFLLNFLLAYLAAIAIELKKQNFTAFFDLDKKKRKSVI